MTSTACASKTLKHMNNSGHDLQRKPVLVSPLQPVVGDNSQTRLRQTEAATVHSPRGGV